MRLLCVLVPHFPYRCETIRHPALKGRDAAVIREADSQQIVLDFSPGIEGLRPGMTLQEALSLRNEIEITHADMPYYAFVFDELLNALEEISPLVEGAEPGLAYIGLDGMQYIYENDEAVIAAVKEAIPASFEPQMGIAEGKFPAYLAAMSCQLGGYRILTGSLADFLKDLSCDVLPISEKSKTKLHDFGITKLSQAAALPPGPIQAQFGPEGMRLLELAGGGMMTTRSTPAPMRK